MNFKPKKKIYIEPMTMVLKKSSAQLVLLFLFSIGTGPVLAQEDSFLLRGTGPKYWIAYEYCFETNIPIPEDRWKANIDWMEANFKPYGYDMVSNDGWIEAAQTVNEQGYITKYNDQWEHGFGYWANYLKERDMKMGVYYNPMWMTKAAFDQNVTVGGTTHKAQDIVGPISFNEPLYWVDTDKEGAKEWIQGYVEYFIDLGATYLRIDFLENYERNYGTTKYIQALQWIKEAAADRIFLSLVMPNCFEHCRTELKYGDMIRIDDDCFGGGWDFVSDRRRGEQRPIWPQYGNAFDGFLGFADLGGRGQMILDGDFMRLNTMANDTERIFMFSLMVMGGSALAIADQFDTIGESAWIYQNRELLELNGQGFVGKPLSYDHKDIAKSSVWAGQLPNGDWVVGLFNRENTKQVRSIDFDRDLGITGQVKNVRDLWTHTDLGGLAGGYSIELEPHQAKVIRIESGALKFEAEFASMINGAERGVGNFRSSGLGYVQGFNAPGDKVLWAVEVPKKGKYSLSIKYGNSSTQTTLTDLSVNGKLLKEPISIPGLGKKNEWAEIQRSIPLNAGTNYISIGNYKGNGGDFKLDFIEILE